LGLLKGPSAVSGLAAYDKIFSGGGDDLMPDEAVALDELFLANRACSKAAVLFASLRLFGLFSLCNIDLEFG
jgi:hypothetical protein